MKKYVIIYNNSCNIAKYCMQIYNRTISYDNCHIENNRREKYDRKE